MSPKPNVATSDMVTGKDSASDLAGADSVSGGAGDDAYPMMGDAGKPASAAQPEKAAVGEVLRKGAAPPKEVRGRKADELVTVRITKSGHGKVHDGQGGAYDWNDETTLPYAVALAQEGNTNVEIIG